MPNTVVLKISGLETQPNSLGSVMPGALLQADNIVVDRDSVAEPRRGFALYGDAFVSATDRAKQLLTYKGRILRHHGTTIDCDSDGIGTFVTLGTGISSPDSVARIKSVESNSNLYLTSDKGIKKIAAASAATLASAAATDAGIATALDLTLALTGGASWFPDNNIVAYRVIWTFKDANNNLVFGPPSPRTMISNTSGVGKAVTLQFPIPQGITTSYNFQIYRTAYFSPISADPGDEMNLVVDQTVTSAQITAGLVTIEDVRSDDLRQFGANLYTNAISGEGILKSNYAPPLAKDLALYKQYLFFGNVVSKQSLETTLLSVSNLVSNTSFFTITDGTTSHEYVFRSSGDGGEDTAGGYVLISGASTDSEKVDETARSLVRVINRQASEIVYAQYIGGDIDALSGKILLQARSLQQGAFHLLVNDAATTGKSFDPALPTAGSSVISSNDAAPNRVFYSKFQQPEHVPLVNFFDVGPKDEAVLRVIALRDSLFVLKEKSIWRITGETEDNFALSLFDNTVSVLAPDTAAALFNQIHFFGDGGIRVLSEAGMDVVSRSMENLILGLPSLNSNFSQASFGVAYQSDRSYLLWTVTNPSDTVATQCFRYNGYTKAWTRWPIAKTSAVVNKGDDKLYLGASDTNFIEQERKSFTRFDYADREIDISVIQGPLSSEVTISSTSGVSIGDVLSQTQYLTLVQYNTLLKKIDLDLGVPSNNYFSSLQAIPGDDLNAKLADLALKLDTEMPTVGGQTYTQIINAVTNSNLLYQEQLRFNAIVNALQISGVAQGLLYKLSTGNINFNMPITAVSAISVTTLYQLPFIAGAAIVLKHITSQIKWSPEHSGDPSMLKHYYEATAILDKNSFTSAIASFSSDLSPSFEDTSFVGAGTGAWGFTPWGQGTWGGSGTAVPLRTYVPREKQRCRYLNCKFEHASALEKYSLFGFSLTFNPTSTRAYK